MNGGTVEEEQEEQFNTELAVRILARIENTQVIGDLIGHWRQSAWAVCPMPDDLPEDERYANEGDVIVDASTGLPIGVGSCGTAHCFAGWGSQMLGAQLLWEGTGRSYTATKIRTEDGYVYIHDYMMEALRLPDREEYSWADADDDSPGLHPLFESSNTLDDLYMYVARYSDLAESQIRRMVTDERDKDVVAATAASQP